MQDWCTDYYEADYASGCCLECPKSYDGCLCYDCKCKKCYWYSPPEDFMDFDEAGDPKGVCDLALERRKVRLKKRKQFPKKNGFKLPQTNLSGKHLMAER